MSGYYYNNDSSITTAKLADDITIGATENAAKIGKMGEGSPCNCTCNNSWLRLQRFMKVQLQCHTKTTGVGKF